MPRTTGTTTSSNEALYAFDAAKRAEHGVLCGVDEAGRGPLCGPVCCAAVILNPDDPIAGVNDSKKLTEKRREALFEEITNRALAYKIVFISLSMRAFIPRRSKARNIAVSGPLAISKPSKRMVSQILFLFIPVK